MTDLQRPRLTHEELAERVARRLPQAVEAARLCTDLLVSLQDGEVNDEYGYGVSSHRHRQITLAGGGPAAWLHIVWGEDDEVDHCYVEWTDWDGRAVWLVPPEWAEELANALELPAS